jgi:hypothetical protein
VLSYRRQGAGSTLVAWRAISIPRKSGEVSFYEESGVVIVDGCEVDLSDLELAEEIQIGWCCGREVEIVGSDG